MTSDQQSPDADQVSDGDATEYAWVSGELARLPRQPMPPDVQARLLATVQAGSGRGPAAVPQQRSSASSRRTGSWLMVGAGVAAAAAVLGIVAPFDGGQEPIAAPELASVARVSAAEYTAGGLDTQITAGLAPAGRTTTGTVTTEAMKQMADCVRALRLAEPPILVERARYEGRPALVVVANRPGGWSVVIQRPTCTAADPAVIARATVDRPAAGTE